MKIFVTPRVCFCPSIVKCLYAIEGPGFDIDDIPRLREHWNGARRNLAVYQTTARLQPAGNVPDKYETGERWSRQPIEVTFQGFVDINHFVQTGKIRYTTVYEPLKGV